MSQKIFVILLFFSTRIYSQHIDSSILFTVEKYRDTTQKNTDDYEITFKLKNNSNKALLVWNSPERQIYFKAIYLNKSKDTINTENAFANMDIAYVTPPQLEKIEPGNFKEMKFSSLPYLNQSGSVKIKFIFRFDSQNGEMKTAESDWITQYFRFSLSDIIK